MENENNFVEENQSIDLSDNENSNSENMMPLEEKKDGVVGPIIGSLVIIILIIIGGMYFWGSVVEKKSNLDPIENEALLDVEATSIEDIENDLEETNLDDLDANLGEIEAEIDASIGE